MNCRFCNTALDNVFIDLVNSPASNSFLTKEQLTEPEVFYPLKVYTCPTCFLVQIDEYKKSDEIFNQEYVYFSSYSSSWLQHAKNYVEMVTERFHLNKNSQIIEIASNDGYLLQYFREKNIPVLGIEPSVNTADVARQKGIDSINEFFGKALAGEMLMKNIKADLLLGNNVLAHVPDIVDFVGALKMILKEDGIITMEFPHLMQLIDNNQFDTIYHEHFSYLSFSTVKKIFESVGLEMFDVDEIPTHGGSLRIYAKHKKSNRPVSDNVEKLIEREKEKGMHSIEYYEGFQQRALEAKLSLLDFLVTQKRQGKVIAGYGAAAKGNTMLNFCGIKNDLIDFMVDANPAKQNKFLPASHIAVENEEYLKRQRPDFVIILPWNLKAEISDQLNYIRGWNGKFVTAIPSLEVF